MLVTKIHFVIQGQVETACGIQNPNRSDEEDPLVMTCRTCKRFVMKSHGVMGVWRG